MKAPPPPASPPSPPPAVAASSSPAALAHAHVVRAWFGPYGDVAPEGRWLAICGCGAVADARAGESGRLHLAGAWPA